MHKNRLIKLIAINTISLAIIFIPYVVFGQSGGSGGTGSTTSGGWGTNGLASIDNSVTGLQEGTITNIVKYIMLWLLGLVGFAGVIGFAIAGIFYLTAAGDDSRMETGKNAMKWSIIGVVVALMGYVIIQAVDALLGGTTADF